MASGNTEIVAKIKDITNALNGLKNAAKDASASARLVGQAFEAGINNTTAQQAFDAYGVAIEKTKAAIAEYETKIKELEATQAGLDKTSKTYAADFSALTGKIATQKNALVKLNEQYIELGLAQKKYSKETLAAAEAEKQAAATKELNAQKIEKLKSRQQTLNKVMRTATVVITALVAAFKKMTTAAIEQGTELYSLSKRYGASVEDIQTMNRALQLATGQSDLFTNSLSVLAKGMSDIAGNRGQKYTAALRAVGTSYKELSTMNRAEQFSAIIQGLQGIENESIRAAHAQTLLGESGQYIIGALERSKYSLEDYVAQAEKYSKITTQNAEDLTYMGFRLEAVKSEMNVMTAQMVIDAQPVIINVMKLLKGLIPILNVLTKNGWLLFTVIAALIALKFATALMSWRVSMLSAGAAAASTARKVFIMKAIMGGVIAVAATVTAAFAAWGASASLLSDDVDEANSSLNKLQAQNGEYNSNIERTYTSSNERTVNISVDIYGEGDTAISDGAATTIAQLTADEVNRNLGALIKGN